MFALLAQVATDSLPQLTGLGSAGVMGAMWLWERKSNRTREEQLDEAHARIMADKIQLEQLIATVKQNTEAMTRLTGMLERKA